MNQRPPVRAFPVAGRKLVPPEANPPPPKGKKTKQGKKGKKGEKGNEDNEITFESDFYPATTPAGSVMGGLLIAIRILTGLADHPGYKAFKQGQEHKEEYAEYVAASKNAWLLLGILFDEDKLPADQIAAALETLKAAYKALGVYVSNPTEDAKQAVLTTSAEVLPFLKQMVDIPDKYKFWIMLAFGALWSCMSYQGVFSHKSQSPFAACGQATHGLMVTKVVLLDDKRPRQPFEVLLSSVPVCKQCSGSFVYGKWQSLFKKALDAGDSWFWQQKVKACYVVPTGTGAAAVKAVGPEWAHLSRDQRAHHEAAALLLFGEFAPVPSEREPAHSGASGDDWVEREREQMDWETLNRAQINAGARAAFDIGMENFITTITMILGVLPNPSATVGECVAAFEEQRGDTHYKVDLDPLKRVVEELKNEHWCVVSVSAELRDLHRRNRVKTLLSDLLAMCVNRMHEWNRTQGIARDKLPYKA